MRAQLTAKQQLVYNFIVEFIRENKYPPTYRDIMRKFGLKSINNASSYLNILKEKGYIKTKYGARTIQLIDDVLEDHTVSAKQLSDALEKMKERGTPLSVGLAVDFLSELDIGVV